MASNTNEGRVTEGGNVVLPGSSNNTEPVHLQDDTIDLGRVTEGGNVVLPGHGDGAEPVQLRDDTIDLVGDCLLYTSPSPRDRG